MAVQRQRRRVLLDKLTQRRAADVPTTRHCVQRRVEWWRVAHIDCMLRVASLRQCRQRLGDAWLRRERFGTRRLDLAAPADVGHIKAEWWQRLNVAPLVILDAERRERHTGVASQPKATVGGDGVTG